MTRLPLLTLLLQVAAAPALAEAQQTGLLVVAHGAGPAWNAGVRETVAQVEWAHGPVEVAFLMGPEVESAGWSAGIKRLEVRGAERIVVVPLMISSHGSHYRQVRYYAGELPEPPRELQAHSHGADYRPTLPMTVTAALDNSPELGAAMALRWTELRPALREGPLVLLGHGPAADDEALHWLSAFERIAEGVQRAGHRGERRVALLRDDAPPPVRSAAVQALRDTIAALADRAGDSVAVMTVLVAQGAMTEVTIPRDLAGLPIHYAPTGLTPHPAIARWIERIGAEGLANLPNP